MTEFCATYTLRLLLSGDISCPLVTPQPHHVTTIFFDNRPMSCCRRPLTTSPTTHASTTLQLLPVRQTCPSFCHSPTTRTNTNTCRCHTSDNCHRLVRLLADRFVNAADVKVRSHGAVFLQQSSAPIAAAGGLRRAARMRTKRSQTRESPSPVSTDACGMSRRDTRSRYAVSCSFRRQSTCIGARNSERERDCRRGEDQSLTSFPVVER